MWDADRSGAFGALTSTIGEPVADPGTPFVPETAVG
jgi:hypothetical protein